MTYQETIKYLASFINYEKIALYPYKESLKLQRIKDFLAAIDNPQEGLKCVHIAGTKGKGSTCAFIAYILREAGYKTGFYTSPHLSDFRERIRILRPRPRAQRCRLAFEGMISREDLSRLVTKLRPAIDRYNRHSVCGALSFFEVYTALAFVYFKEKRVDYVVLETGLGGRLDATNVVRPLVCAITPISYEHTQKLGHTLRAIAGEKAGIIKDHSIVVSAPQAKEALRVIKRRCRDAKARLFLVKRDIHYKKLKRGFEVKGLLVKIRCPELNLIGEHQMVNAAVAAGVIEALRLGGAKIGIKDISRGLYNTLWPGRCEVISRAPHMVLDGAQNVASARALKLAVRNSFKYEKLAMVLGISTDKDLKGLCGEFKNFADIFILTKADNPRATDPKVLATYFRNSEVHLTDNVREAVNFSLNTAGTKDLILVTGSLFVVGEARRYVEYKKVRR